MIRTHTCKFTHTNSYVIDQSYDELVELKLQVLGEVRRVVVDDPEWKLMSLGFYTKVI
jgi:hypothetical protein